MNEAIEIPADKLPAAAGARTLWHTEGHSIALFNVDGVVHAVDDKCPHAGSSLFSGVVEGRVVQCRSHGLKFDLATGCMRGAVNFGVKAYLLEQRGERYFLVPRPADAPSC